MPNLRHQSRRDGTGFITRFCGCIRMVLENSRTAAVCRRAFRVCRRRVIVCKCACLGCQSVAACHRLPTVSCRRSSVLRIIAFSVSRLNTSVFKRGATGIAIPCLQSPLPDISALFSFSGQHGAQKSFILCLYAANPVFRPFDM